MYDTVNLVALNNMMFINYLSSRFRTLFSSMFLLHPNWKRLMNPNIHHQLRPLIALYEHKNEVSLRVLFDITLTEQVKIYFLLLA